MSIADALPKSTEDSLNLRVPGLIAFFYDGYEEGAANYLYHAFMVSRQMDAESMLRGNDRAEITRAHDTHGDTDYRYTIDGNNLLAEHFERDETWKTVFNGDWVDFINTYVPKSGWVEDFQELKRVDFGYVKGLVHTPKTLQAEIDKDTRTLGTWAANGNAKGGNWDSMVKRVGEMRANLTSYEGPAWAKAA